MVLAAECRLSGKSYFLRAASNAHPGARLGLIASRKAARRAVDRNRGKRIAREAFRVARAQLPAVDVVLQLKNDLRAAGNLQLRQELDRLLRDRTQSRGGRRRPLDSEPLGREGADQRAADRVVVFHQQDLRLVHPDQGTGAHRTVDQNAARFCPRLTARRAPPD